MFDAECDKVGKCSVSVIINTNEPQNEKEEREIRKQAKTLLETMRVIDEREENVRRPASPEKK